MIIPLALNKHYKRFCLNKILTVSFSKISTNISLFLFFLLSSYPIGLVIASEETVLDLNIFGINLDVVGAFLAVAID
jgi:hypothetical protein